MPDPIFIADEPEPTVTPEERAQIRAAALAAEKADQVARCVAWLASLTVYDESGEIVSDASDDFKALAAEWADLRGSVPTLSTREHKYNGRTVYIVKSAHGEAESLQSYDHALFLLVDAHRTRTEDRPATHARLEALGMSTEAARERCQAIGRDVVKAHGRRPIAEHDALVEAEISKLEAQAKVPPQPAPPVDRRP